MVIIKQNVTNTIVLPLKDYFTNEQMRNLQAIEVTIGEKNKNEQVRKLFYVTDKDKSDINFIRHNNSIEFALNATESSYWKYQVPAQIRIKNRDNVIASSDIFYCYIEPSLSAEEF